MPERGEDANALGRVNRPQRRIVNCRLHLGAVSVWEHSTDEGTEQKKRRKKQQKNKGQEAKANSISFASRTVHLICWPKEASIIRITTLVVVASSVRESCLQARTTS
jgi:hypothetical protein